MRGRIAPVAVVIARDTSRSDSDSATAIFCSIRSPSQKCYQLIIFTAKYSCETWHPRSDDIRCANIARNNSLRKVFNSLSRERETVKPVTDVQCESKK